MSEKAGLWEECWLNWLIKQIGASAVRAPKERSLSKCYGAPFDTEALTQALRKLPLSVSFSYGSTAFWTRWEVCGCCRRSSSYRLPNQSGHIRDAFCWCFPSALIMWLGCSPVGEKIGLSATDRRERIAASHCSVSSTRCHCQTRGIMWIYIHVRFPAFNSLFQYW